MKLRSPSKQGKQIFDQNIRVLAPLLLTQVFIGSKVKQSTIKTFSSIDLKDNDNTSNLASILLEISKV